MRTRKRALNCVEVSHLDEVSEEHKLIVYSNMFKLGIISVVVDNCHAKHNYINLTNQSIIDMLSFLLSKSYISEIHNEDYKYYVIREDGYIFLNNYLKQTTNVSNIKIKTEPNSSIPNSYESRILKDSNYDNIMPSMKAEVKMEKGIKKETKYNINKLEMQENENYDYLELQCKYLKKKIMKLSCALNIYQERIHFFSTEGFMYFKCQMEIEKFSRKLLKYKKLLSKANIKKEIISNSSNNIKYETTDPTLIVFQNNYPFFYNTYLKEKLNVLYDHIGSINNKTSIYTLLNTYVTLNYNDQSVKKNKTYKPIKVERLTKEIFDESDSGLSIIYSSCYKRFNKTYVEEEEV